MTGLLEPTRSQDVRSIDGRALVTSQSKANPKTLKDNPPGLESTWDLRSNTPEKKVGIWILGDVCGEKPVV